MYRSSSQDIYCTYNLKKIDDSTLAMGTDVPVSDSDRDRQEVEASLTQRIGALESVLEDTRTKLIGARKSGKAVKGAVGDKAKDKDTAKSE